MGSRRILCLLIAVGVASTAMAMRPGRRPGGGGGGIPAMQDQTDMFAAGQRAFEAKQYLSAKELLSRFIDASVGDAKIPAAKKMMNDAWLAAADQLWNASDFEGALTTWAEYSQQYKDEKEGTAAKTLARQKAGDEFTALIKQQKFRAAVDLADDYKAQFPDEPALVDAEVFQSGCIDMMSQAMKNGTDAQTLSELLDQVIADGVKEEKLEVKGISPWAIRLGLANALFQHNELNKAIALATKSAADCPAEFKEKFQKIIAQAMIARAEAYSKFGNLPMLEAALSEMDNAPVGPEGKATQARLTADVKKKIAAVGMAAHVLKMDKPVQGNGKWSDDGAGYTIDGTVTLDHATINVTAGFVLDGGSITIKNGALNIDGSNAQPVIFRNVKIQIEPGGSITANGAIFENCSFKENGFSFSRYATRWKFTECLLVNSNFNGLGGELGLHIADSVIVDSKFPDRILFAPNPGDAARTYRDDGNQVMDDAFIRCKIPPSFAWATQKCFFEDCKVTGNEMWRSTTTLVVKLAVLPDDVSFVDRLRFATTFEVQGIVNYTGGTVADVKAHSLVFFQYVGMGGGDKQQQ